MRAMEAREAEAQRRIAAMLPPGAGARYGRTGADYERCIDREAEIARAVDCLDACVRKLDDATSPPADGFTEEFIRATYAPHVRRFAVTERAFELPMRRLVALGRVGDRSERGLRNRSATYTFV